MNPLNILIVHNKYKIPGGEDTVVEAESKLLREAGHKVIPYIRSNDELDSMGIIGKLSALLHADYSKRVYKDVTALIKREKIDIVHVHNTQLIITPSVYYAAVDAGIPVVQTVHNFRLVCPGALCLRDGAICTECIDNTKGLSNAKSHACYRGSKLQTHAAIRILTKNRKREIYKKINYICLTEFNKNLLLSANKLGNEIFDPDKFFIKPNFADAPNTIIPYQNRKREFVCISRLSTEKGVDLLVNAYAKYESLCNNEQLSPFTLSIYGSGPLEEQIKKQISETGSTNIILKGQKSHSEVLWHLSQVSALLFPTTWFEGFPMVLAEAKACGTPVITADIGNAGNLVEDSRTGIKYSSIDQLPELLLQWTKDESSIIHTQMSEASISEFESHYTPSANLSILEQIYTKVLSK